MNVSKTKSKELNERILSKQCFNVQRLFLLNIESKKKMFNKKTFINNCDTQADMKKLVNSMMKVIGI